MEDYVYGRNSVIEHLRSNEAGEKLYVQKGNRGKAIGEAIHRAKDQGLPVVQADRHKMDKMVKGGNHQGLILLATGYKYASLEEVLAHAEAMGHPPFLVLLEEITDPQNLGAIIRTAECAGVDGVLITKHRSAPVNSTVHKISSGADASMPVVKITNVSQTIETLKEKNIWVYGADGTADQTLWQTNFSGPVCLVIGNEGRGLAKHTRKNCDQLVSIPMFGKVDSLNASASAAVLIYEIVRGRMEG